MEKNCEPAHAVRVYDPLIKLEKKYGKKLWASEDGHKLYTPNNFNNRVVSPPKGKILEGQPPRYSNQQQKFLKLFIKNNNELLEQENLPTPPLPNSASWLSTPSTQPTTNPSSSWMYVLKKNSDSIDYLENFYRDDDEYEWK